MLARNTATILLTELQAYSDVPSFPTNGLPSVPGSHPGSHMTFIHHISFIPSSLWQFLSLSSASATLTPLKSNGQVFL